MPYFQVQLKRSLIGLPSSVKATAQALGLNKTGRIIHHNINQSVAGKLLKLKELVKVDIIQEKKTIAELRETRKSDPGFTVEKQVKDVEI